MEKPAKTNFEIHPLLKKRWSPRSFTDQPVEKTSLQRIFEAARWAPSSYNEQPWRFIIGIKGDDTWNKIMETLVSFNQQWARLAPVLVISIGKKVSSKGNKPNNVYQYDLGQSVAHLTVQATEEGLFMHQMGGFDPKKAAEIFDIPEEYQATTVFAIGHKGEPQLLDGDFEDMEKGPRERMSLADMVFEGKFGESAGFLQK